MNALVKYEAARTALAECRVVDEVKTWADKAAAMQAYGRMAKDKQLEVDAAEIRIRAERRLGELLAAQKAGDGLSKGGRPAEKTGPQKVPVSPTLAAAGIDKNLSSRAQKLAAVPEPEFEAEVSQWRERVKAEGTRVSAKLEASGAKQLAAENDGAQSAAELLQELQTENEALRGRIKSMSADDAKAEILKHKRIAEAAQRSQSEAMDRAAKALEREAWAMRQLRRCGKVVGEDDPAKIAPKVEAMVRSHRKEAA